MPRSCHLGEGIRTAAGNAEHERLAVSRQLGTGGKIVRPTVAEDAARETSVHHRRIGTGEGKSHAARRARFIRDAGKDRQYGIYAKGMVDLDLEQTVQTPDGAAILGQIIRIGAKTAQVGVPRRAETRLERREGKCPGAVRNV